MKISSLTPPPTRDVLKFYPEIRFVEKIKKFWLINENAFKVSVKYKAKSRDQGRFVAWKP